MNILVTGHWEGFNSEIEQRLNLLGHEARFMELENDDLPCEPSWVEGVVCEYIFERFDISEFTNLEYIQLTSSGMDKITDLDWKHIEDKSVKVCNARGAYSIPMAEYALGAVLSIYRGLEGYRLSQKRGRWEKIKELRELYGSSVCIVGCGSVGSECAVRFRAMGCRVTGVNRSAYVNRPGFDEIHGMEMLDEIMGRSDIIIICVPLTDETRYLIDKDRLGRIRDNQILINLSRGPVLETEGLRNAKGTYILDVFEEEPLGSESFLWAKDNIYLSPHNSWIGEGNDDRLTELVFRNLTDYVKQV